MRTAADVSDDTTNAWGKKVESTAASSVELAMTGGDLGGVHIVHVLEVAGGGHCRSKDVVEGHVGGQHTPCDSQGNQDPAVDPFPHSHFPEKFPV